LNRTEATWSAAYWAAEDTRAGADGPLGEQRHGSHRLAACAGVPWTDIIDAFVLAYAPTALDSVR
jgi:hypothetical protein